MMGTIQKFSGSLLIAGMLAMFGNAASQEPAPSKRSKELSALAISGELVGEQPAAPGAGKSAPENKADDNAQKGDALILPRPAQMHVGLEILSGSKPMRTIQHKGKTYLPVPKVGAEYEIRVWNHGPHRIVAIVSVDGLSVMNGQPASESQSGYIVAPNSQIHIQGWRRSLDAVAAFAFVDREKSYASLTGRPENIGVIGLIAIEELVQTPRPLAEKQDATKSALRAQVGKIGTEYGREIDSRVYYVPFVRSTNKRAITVYYDTVAALRNAGVPVDPPMPVPFPKDSEFAPPPPGYKGSRSDAP
jgi:hypothetical protein